MTIQILKFGHFLVMPFIPTLSLSASLHGMALASPYNPIFLLCYGRIFFQGSTFSIASLVGTLLGYGCFFFFIHEGITGPLYLWYKLEPLLCLFGAIALSISALNLCTLGPGQNTLTPNVVGYSKEELPGISDVKFNKSGRVYKKYGEILLFHCVLSWSNPASFCLSSQSSIADSDMGLGSCFFGMVSITIFFSLMFWLLKNTAVRPVNQALLLDERLNTSQLSTATRKSSDFSGQGFLASSNPFNKNINVDLFLRPRWFREFCTFQWIPYWIIGLTVTSLSQMTWHLFVHYPLEYTQLSSIQRNFDTEVPQSVRRHDPFLRLQDMMRRYPDLKAEFTQTQRERAYIRYNSYPLNVITRKLRMSILSWRNLTYLEREPYEVYHLQQLKNIFDTQPSSFNKSLNPWGSNLAMTTGFTEKDDWWSRHRLIYPRIWKNKEKGNPQFSYSRSLPISSKSSTVDGLTSESYRQKHVMHQNLPATKLSLKFRSSQVLIHDDIAFLVKLFPEHSGTIAAP